MDAVLPVRVVPGMPVAPTELRFGVQLGNLARAVTDEGARAAVRVPEALWADLQASGLLPDGVP